MKTKLLLPLLAALATGPASLPAQTAFTYQGKLVDDCCPATDYDLTFKVYDGATTGTQMGGTVSKAAVPVTNGLFNVSLDFGSGPFNGAPRWLQIDVRTNNATPPASFVTLAPRTELTATPYAVRAASASTVPDNAITRPKIASGQVVKSLNGLTDAVNLVAGHNVTLTPSGNNLTIASTGEGVFSLNGNRAYYNGGNVGIGTSSPDWPLTLAPTSTIVIKDPVDPNWGTFLGADSEGNGTLGVAGHNLAIYGGFDKTLQLGTAQYNQYGGKVVFPGGNVGIGTTSPKATLHVNGDYYGLGHMYLHAYEGDGNSGTAYVQARDTSGTSSLDLQFRTQRNGVIVDALRLGSDGMTTVKALTITGGADLAEPFQMSDEKIAEGSVVVIDEENPGHLKRATSAYDTRVAGIVSGANGINAGIALHQEGALEGGQNVALTGRVYVKADASFGAIKPGDLLTTSDTAGHAMKVLDQAKAQGAILGKAMTALKEGQGMVQVLVSLQ